MLNRPLCLFLAFTMTVSPLQNIWASSSASSTEKYALLRSLANKVEVILQSNVIQLKHLKECFEGVQHPDCKDETLRVGNNIRDKYSTVKYHAFMYHMLNPVRARKLFVDFYSQINPINKISDKKSDFITLPTSKYIGEVQSPLTSVEALSHIPAYTYSSKDIEDIFNQKMPKVIIRNDKTILKQYEYSLSGLLELVCDNAYKMHRKSTFRDYSINNSPEICSQLKVSFSAKTNSFVLNRPVSNETMSHLSYVISNGLTIEATKIIEDRFYKSLSDMPYIGLIRSNHPSDKELAQVFSLMYTNARAELESVQKNYRRAFEGEAAPPSYGEIVKSSLISSAAFLISPAINHKVANGLAGLATNDEQEQTQVNWYYANSFLLYSPVAQSLVKSPSERMSLLVDTDYKAVSAEVESQFSSDQMWDMLAEVSGAISFALVCNVPVTKGGAMLYRGASLLIKARKYRKLSSFLLKARKFDFKSLVCLPSTALLVNWYFLNTAQNRYDDVYQKVFSTLEGETLLAELRTLKSSEQEIIFEGILFPMGIVSVKGMASVSKKLSLKSWNYLKNFTQ